MGHRMGQIEEEGLLIASRGFDKRHRPLRVGGGEFGLICGRHGWVDHPLPIQQRQVGKMAGVCLGMKGPHVVGIGQAEI